MEKGVLHPKTSAATANLILNSHGEVPMLRSFNHDHFLVSPMAHEAKDVVLLVSPSHSVGSNNSSSRGSSSSSHRKGKKQYPRSGPQQPMSPTNELRLQLLQRLTEFRAKGWINPLEERKFIQRLSTHHPNFTDPTDNTARQLKQEMDRIATLYQQRPSDHSKAASYRAGPTAPLIPPSNTMRVAAPPALKKKRTAASRQPNSSRRVSFAPTTSEQSMAKPNKATLTLPNVTVPSIPETSLQEHQPAAPIQKNSTKPQQPVVPIQNSTKPQQPVVPVQTNTKPEQPVATIQASNNSKHTTAPSILEPNVFWNQYLQQQTTNKENSDDSSSTVLLQNMFVEVCFFARLGFVQPPCCLYCSYRESVEQKPANLDCERWVVWRKNALTLLHPHRLDDNLLAVQCRAARLLSSGQTVDSYAWDKSRKQVVLHM